MGHRHKQRGVQKMYFTESWIVLAGDAELARPKSGELWTPTMRVRLVWLKTLKASTLNSRSPFLRGSLLANRRATAKTFVSRTSTVAVAGPRLVLRVMPEGRSFPMVSPLSSNPVVTLNGA